MRDPAIKRLLRALVAGMGGLVSCAWAVSLPLGAPPERSVSGQFIIHSDAIARTGSSIATLATNEHYILLRPSTLTVSAERMRQVVWSELGIVGPWHSKIHIVLYPALSAEDPVTILSERYRDRWQYRVEIPDLLERSKYVRAMCQVLLLEFSNRNVPERSAEVPTWLLEGLSRELLAASELQLMLTPPRASANGIGISSTFLQARRQSPLLAVHEHLKNRAPLTFEQLSWPMDEDLQGERSEHYRQCAHLFVHQLLALDGGRSSLLAMLQELPRNLNWQFAFFRGFSAHFSRPLEVEKWWALQTVHFTGRDLAQMWSVEESWRKLDQVLSSRIQLRSITNEWVATTNISLPAIIREWDRIAQMEVLREKVRELEMLIMRTSPEVVVLADEYRTVLWNYLSSNGMQGPIPPRGKKRPAPPKRTEQTAGLLLALDARRAVVSATNSIPVAELTEAVRAAQTGR